MTIQHSKMEISISNVLHNIRYFRSCLPEGTKLLVLVKAYAYGHGAGEFAKILEDNGVDYLAVAFPEEGVALRTYGVNLPIIVLSATALSYPTLIQNHLEPSIPSLEDLEIYHSLAPGAPFHIKLDTGMHRLGFESSQIDSLCSWLTEHKTARVTSIFSHLAASDEPAWDDFTRSQIALYEENSQKILNVLDYKPIRHILNSAGIERFGKVAPYDMARLGIGIYGVSAVDQANVRPTAFLRVPVLQVKTVPQGDTIGYGRHGKTTDGAKTIATIAVGYADGIDRHLGRGHASFMLNGHLVPTIGNICMDMCMLDVTGLEVKAGDVVTIFGDNPGIIDLARILDTIPYEILTSIAHRVEREYIK